MPKKTAEQKLIDELWDTFQTFDYPRYERIKSGIKKRTPAITGVMTRIESHPTWGKSRSEHNKWVAKREKEEQTSYEMEMMGNALHGRHYKYANVWGGEIRYAPEYRDVCKSLGIVLPKGERVRSDDADLVEYWQKMLGGKRK